MENQNLHSFNQQLYKNLNKKLIYKKSTDFL